MNEEQAKSFFRWVQATIGPFLIAHGYTTESTLTFWLGILASAIPLIWSMFVHTQSNAVAVVDALAKDPHNPVKAVILQPTPAGRELAEAIPGNTTVIAGTVAATAAAER